MWWVPRLIRWGMVFGLLVLLLFLYTTYGCVRVVGDEMARPDKVDAKFPKGKYKIISVQDRSPEILHQGDVVFFDYQHGGHLAGGRGQLTFVGRIIGKPGDRVRMEKGKVYVNGQFLPEGYIDAKSWSDDDLTEVIVPMNCYFILCDNRREGKKVDSRAVGPIGMWAILGRAGE